jgi:predicted nicotinamide N-methyase
VTRDARRSALHEALRRRFVVETVAVPLPGGPVELLKPRSAEELISEDDFLKDERLPYWAELWPSARIFAAHLAGTPGVGRSLLELGCGLGLVTIAALRAGYAVTATDYYDDALLFTRANALAATGREPATRLVDWRSLPADLGRFERVVATDVLYERPYAALVAAAIARTLARRGTAIVADPGRVAAESFLAHAAVHGLRLTSTEELPYEEGEIRQTIRLYRFART